MALANVPLGEQRCRFLAVGLADNTVRIISLDPAVSFFTFCDNSYQTVCERLTVFLLFIDYFLVYTEIGKNIKCNAIGVTHTHTLQAES